MGYFDDWASSPITTVGLPLVAGALATRNPTTARGVGIGLGTLGLIQQAQARNEEDQRRQKLAQVLPSLIGATQPVTSTKIGVDPDKTAFSLPDQNNTQYASLGATPPSANSTATDNLFAPPKPLPTYQATENKPVFSPLQQSVLQTVGQYDPETVARALASKVFAQQAQNKIIGDPEKGIYSVSQSGALTELRPPAKKASIADVIASIPGGNGGQLPPGVSASVPTEGGGRVNLAYPEAANQAKAKRIPPSVARAIGTPNFNTALKAAQDNGEIGEEGVVAAMTQHRAELANQRADKASERADAASARADKLANARLDAVNNPKPESPSILGERANTIAQKLAANGATDAQINAQLAPLNYRVASRQKGWFSDSVTIEPASQTKASPAPSPMPTPTPTQKPSGKPPVEQRFKQLISTGLSESEVYKKLAAEGY